MQQQDTTGWFARRQAGLMGAMRSSRAIQRWMLALWLSLAAMGAWGQQPALEVAVGHAVGQAGQHVTLPLSVAPSPAAIQLELEHSVQLQPKGWVSAHDFDYAPLGSSRLRLVFYQDVCAAVPQARTSQQLVRDLEWQIASAAAPGAIPVQLHNVLAAGSSGQFITPDSIAHGSVTVLSGGAGGADNVRPVDGLGFPALALLTVLMVLVAVWLLRRRPQGLVLCLMVGSGTTLLSMGPIAGHTQGASPTAVMTVLDVLLERSEAFTEADQNNDGVVDVRDLVLALQAQCPPEEANRPPSIEAVADQRIGAGVAWQLPIQASDPDAEDTLRYTLPQAPQGASIRADGLVQWTPSSGQLGTHVFVVAVRDQAEASAQITFQVEVVAAAPDNRPPSIAPVADRSIRAGQVLALNIAGSDPDAGDVLRYTIEQAPRGVALDAGAGHLLWVPTEAQLGAYPVTVRVTDRGGLSASASFQVQVLKIGAAPVLAPLDDRALVAGQTLNVTAQASDPDLPDDTLQFALAAAPTGLAIDAGTGRITWTPAADQLGLHDVTVQVSDRNGLTDFSRFVITVREPNRAPLARDDSYLAPRGTTTQIAAPGVIGNDEDRDGDSLTATLVDGPSHGTLHLNADGSFDYRPGPPEGTPFEAVQAYRQTGWPWPNGTLSTFAAAGGMAVGDLDGDGRTEIVAHGIRAAGAENYRWLVSLRANAQTGQLDVVNARHYHWWAPAEDHDYIFNEHSPPTLVDLDGDGTLEVLMRSYCFGEITAYNHDLSPRFTTRDFDPDCIANGAGVWTEGGINQIAVADLDGDGNPEIIHTVSRGSPWGNPANVDVVARDKDGTIVWTSKVDEAGMGNGILDAKIVIADLDLDGHPDILVGPFLLDHLGVLKWRLPASIYNGGSTLYSVHTAVANLDDDPFGEIIAVSGSGGVEVRKHDGSCLWRSYWATSSPPSSYGCPVLHSLPRPESYAQQTIPTRLVVADIDGDGQPEIVFTVRHGVYALKRDGTLLWKVEPRSVASEDAWLATETLTVFDFNGDGVMEVVVAGQGVSFYGYTRSGGIHFLDGRDGSQILALPGAHEHPGGASASGETPDALIADIDDDGRAEYLVGSNSSRSGVFAYQSGSAPWMPARPLWNQYDYQITNVNPDGTIPARPLANWLQPGLNNYRVNSPTLDEPGGSDQFTYKLSDGTLESNTATVSLEIRRANRAPVILSTPPTVVGAGFTYRYPVLATDADPGDSVALALDAAPAGAHFDAATATVHWAPSAADLGEHRVLVSARDSEGAITVQDYTLRVVTPQPVPDVTGQPQATAVSAIEAADFVAGRIRQSDHPTVPAGAVAAQTPPGGAHQAPGSAIDLIVSTGPGPADRDADGDGFTPNQGDCNDSDTGIHPGAIDPEGDGIDQNCDGLDGSRTPEAILVRPDSATLLVGESLQLSAFARFADGSAQPLTGAVTWSSSDAAVQIDAGGRLIAQSAGTTTVHATRNGQSGSAQVGVIARDGSDSAAPLAEIASPAGGAEVLGPVDILGSASDPNLVRYELAISPVGEERFTALVTGTTAVTDGVLGRLDPTGLLNGHYRLRLSVLDAGGNRSLDEVTVHIDGQQKAGLFTLSYTDLALPLAGLPIDVLRGYDSRDKQQGDFGIGWQLELRRFGLQCSAQLGEGWAVAGGGLSYQLYATTEHTCSLRLPNGRTEVFDFVPSVTNSQIVPFSALSGRFQPRPGTLGQLSIAAGINLLIVDAQPGDVSLFDDTTLALFDPQHFLYRQPDGSEIALSLGSGVERIRDANGHTLTFSADGIRHSSGVGIAIERDAQGRIVRITDPTGASQSYAYSAAGDLVAHTDAEGHLTRYFYNADHGLVRIEDPLGRSVARNEYDAQGRLLATTTAEGRRVEYAFDLSARQQVTTDFDGSISVTEFDERGNVLRVTDPLGQVSSYAYDANDNQTRATTPDGATTTRSFDVHGNRLSETDPLGRTQHWEWDAADRLIRYTDALGHVTRWAYDSRGNLVETTDALGGTERYIIDAAGNRTGTVDALGHVRLTEYDASGLPVARTDARGYRETTEYDAAGRALKSTDRRGIARSRRYDSRGLPLEQRDGLGGVTAFAFDPRGAIAAITDPAGAVVRLERDGEGRGTAVLDALGQRSEQRWSATGALASTLDADGRESTYDYDALSRRTVATLPDGGTRRIGYDQAGRVASMTDARGNVTTYAYDAAGRQARITDALGHTTGFEYDAAGNLIGRTDALGRTWSHAYDALGRRTGTTYPDGNSERIDYDALGRVVARTDALDRVTRYDYDAEGNLTQVTDALGGITRYGYDEVGNRITQTDANGHVVAFEYDAEGRQSARIEADGTRSGIEYDAAGNPVRLVKADASVIEQTYDANGRLVERRLPDGSQTRFAYTASGRLASATDARGETVYRYDGQDRLIGVEHPDGSSLGYVWDAAGNRSEVTTQLPDGTRRTVQYRYDVLDRLVEVEDAAGIAQYGYDAVGNLVQASLPNGTSSHYEYDLRGHATRVEHRRGAVVLASYAYTLDAFGDRIRVDQADGSAVTWEYDALRRLVRERHTGAGGIALRDIGYAYDAVGNRLQHSETAAGQTIDYAYDAADRLIGAGAASFDYDASGNLVAVHEGAAVIQYRYDALDRLVESAWGGTVRTYHYDAQGNRIGAGASDFLLDLARSDGYSQVLEEYDTAGSLASYTFGLHRLAQTRGGQRHFHHHDAGLSTRLLSDAAGQASDRYDYDAFGNPVGGAGSTVNPLRYAGEHLDPVSGLYHLRARDYAPRWGRFTSRDPFPGLAERPVTLHRYLYANANPIGYRDPDGRFGLSLVISTQLSVAAIQKNYNFMLVNTFMNALDAVNGFVAVGARSQQIGLDAIMDGYVTEGSLNLALGGQAMIGEGLRMIGSGIAKEFVKFGFAMLPSVELQLTRTGWPDFKWGLSGIAGDLAAGSRDVSIFVPGIEIPRLERLGNGVKGIAAVLEKVNANDQPAIEARNQVISLLNDLLP